MKWGLRDETYQDLFSSVVEVDELDVLEPAVAVEVDEEVVLVLAIPLSVPPELQ
jgi:hypothetical protein